MLSTAAGTAKETEWCGRIAGALATAAKSCRHAAAGPHARGLVKAGLHGTGRKTAVRLAATCAAGAQALRTLAGPRQQRCSRPSLRGPSACAEDSGTRGRRGRGRRTLFRRREELAGMIRRRAGGALAPTPPPA